MPWYIHMCRSSQIVGESLMVINETFPQQIEQFFFKKRLIPVPSRLPASESTLTQVMDV